MAGDQIKSLAGTTVLIPVRCLLFSLTQLTVLVKSFAFGCHIENHQVQTDCGRPGRVKAANQICLCPAELDALLLCRLSYFVAD